MGINKVAFFFLCPLSVCGQVDRYFVSFKDKGHTPYSVSAPEKFLSSKSIARRARENFAVLEEDLPVDTAYVRQVRATGTQVFFTSRWFNGVLVQTDASTASRITTLPFVAGVELVAHGSRLLNGRQSSKSKFQKASAVLASNQMQLRQIGVDAMQAAGYHGQGVDVAVFDAGFVGVNQQSAFQSLFTEGRIRSTYNFVKNITDVFSDDDHGTEVLSLMAANGNNYLGGADQANYYLYETEDVATEYRVEEYNWAFAAEKADSAGVDVINSSLGYNTFDDPTMNYTWASLNGEIAISSQAARKAVLRGMLVVNSAGNEGGNSWRYVDVPADAAGVLACGSVDETGARSFFSSVGPTADGRIKPDVAATGSGAVVVMSSGVVGTNNGTSFSSPLIASLAAGLRQALPQSSSREIYFRIVNSGSQADHPDNLLGYGIPNFALALAWLDFNDEFVLYPNPIGVDPLKMLFKNVMDQKLTIIVRDLSGRELATIVDTLTWDNNPYTLDLSALAAGVYFVTVTTPTASKTQKIVRIN